MGVWKEQEVAVKLARQKPISLKQERNFQQQAARLFRLDHPNIVRFLGACCWKVLLLASINITDALVLAEFATFATQNRMFI